MFRSLRVFLGSKYWQYRQLPEEGKVERPSANQQPTSDVQTDISGWLLKFLHRSFGEPQGEELESLLVEREKDLR